MAHYLKTKKLKTVKIPIRGKGRTIPLEIGGNIGSIKLFADFWYTLARYGEVYCSGVQKAYEVYMDMLAMVMSKQDAYNVDNCDMSNLPLQNSNPHIKDIVSKRGRQLRVLRMTDKKCLFLSNIKNGFSGESIDLAYGSISLTFYEISDIIERHDEYVDGIRVVDNLIICGVDFSKLHFKKKVVNEEPDNAIDYAILKTLEGAYKRMLDANKSILKNRFCLLSEYDGTVYLRVFSRDSTKTIVGYSLDMSNEIIHVYKSEGVDDGFWQLARSHKRSIRDSILYILNIISSELSYISIKSIQFEASVSGVFNRGTYEFSEAEEGSINIRLYYE